MFDSLKNEVERKAKSGVLVLVAGASIIVGAAFLTHAAWTSLVLAFGVVAAGQIIGGAYLLAGGVLLLVARHPQPDRSAQQNSSEKGDLAQAFLQGVHAGQKAAAKTR